MATQKSRLTPATLRRLTEPLVTVLADLDEALYKREAFSDVVDAVFTNALAAGVSRETMLKIAKNYEDYDNVISAINVHRNFDVHFEKVASPAVLKRHLAAFIDALGEAMRLFHHSEGMKSVAFEMFRAARGAGVSGEFLAALIDGVDQPHHSENLRSVDFTEIRLLA